MNFHGIRDVMTVKELLSACSVDFKHIEIYVNGKYTEALEVPGFIQEYNIPEQYAECGVDTWDIVSDYHGEYNKDNLSLTLYVDRK